MSGLLLAFLLAAESVISARTTIPVDKAAWTNDAPMGFRIYDYRLDKGGIGVFFDTDLEPPYLVGVFVAMHGAFSMPLFPIRHTIVNDKAAYLEGWPFVNKTVFIQVGTTNSMMRGIGGQDLTDEQIRSYEEKVAKNLLPKYEDDWDQDAYSEKGKDAEVVGDGVWATYVDTMDPSISFRGHGKTLYEYPVTNTVQTYVSESQSFWSNRTTSVKSGFYDDNCYTNQFYHGNDVFDRTRLLEVVDGGGPELFVRELHERTLGDFHLGEEFVVTTNVVSSTTDWQEFGPFDVSRGTGYRVLRFEDGTFHVSRAYSARTNRSDRLVIRRPVMSYSAHGGKKVSTDWVGSLTLVSETNAVPDKIYMKGL